MEIPFNIFTETIGSFTFIYNEGLGFCFTTIRPYDGNVIVGDIFTVDIDFHECI